MANKRKAARRSPKLKHELMSVLFLDIKGFSELKEKQLERFFLKILPKLADKTKKFDKTHRNTWGDAIVCASRDTSALCRTALDLRDFFRNQVWDQLGLPSLACRISLHACSLFFGRDPFTERNGIIGNQVNIAARIEPITAPGEVFATQEFVDLLTQDGALCETIEIDPLGERHLPKGAGTKQLFRIRRTGDSGEMPALEINAPPPEQWARLPSRIRDGVDSLTSQWDKMLDDAAKRDSKDFKDSPVVQKCVENVASVYLNELHKVRKGDLAPVELPESVRIGRVVHHYNADEVAYFTTHVGMYARLLSELVNTVEDSTSDDKKPCLGIITNVLPAHWWNWPVGLTRWYHHPSIAAYRDRLAKTARSHQTWTERIILVHEEADWNRILTKDDHNDQNAGGASSSYAGNPRGDWKLTLLDEGYYGASSSYAGGPRGGRWRSPDGKDVFCRASPLWPEPLTVDMDNWCVLDDTDPIPHYRRHDYLTYQLLPFLDCFRPDDVQQNIRDAGFFPMVRSDTEPGSDFAPLISTYTRVLHGDKNGEGASWYLPVTEEEFRSPNGFAGYHDVTFLGSVKKKNDRAKGMGANLWLADGDVVGRQWIVAFLASMSAATETMYLAMVQGEALKKLWKQLSKRIQKGNLQPVASRECE